MDSSEFFSETYVEARQKFGAACEASGVGVSSIEHPSEAGPKGEALAIDVAVFGRADAPNMVLINTGTPGLEGFCGSAIVTQWIKRREYESLGDGVGAVKLWDVRSRQEIATLQGHTASVWSVTFSPDSDTLATCSYLPETLKIWDVKTWQEIAAPQAHTDTVYSLAFSPGGQTLASASDDETVKFWDVNTWQEIAELDRRTAIGRDGDFHSVAFSPDGVTLATGNRDTTVKLWDANTRREIATLTGHTGPANSVAFSPDGRLLASGSADGTVKLWRKTP